MTSKLQSCEQDRLLKILLPSLVYQSKNLSRKDLVQFQQMRKEIKRAEISRKQRRKSKQRVAQVEKVSGFSTSNVEPSSVKDFSHIEIPQVLMNKEENAISEGTIADQASKDSTFFVLKKDSSVPAKDKGTSQTATKKKNRKGGLSMFLSGALDDIPKHIILPPATPRSEGPAWGGAKVSMGSASLREIQDEQSKLQLNHLTGSKNQVEDLFDGRNEGKILLRSFLPSNPIPMVSLQASQASDSAPPWASSGTPPHLSQPSLRDIQMLQRGKQLQSLSHSPKTKVSGFPIATGQGSPSDSPGMNRWFKPEVETPSSIRSILIEERAMKDLKRFYSSVKVVKNHS